MKRALQGVEALVGSAMVAGATILMDGPVVEWVDQRGVPAGTEVVAVGGGGWLALPGIVDIHGDAVERSLAPRPAAGFPLGMALVENDRAMLAAGITTAFLSLTDSPEPGLRSRETLRSVIEALPAAGPLGADTRIHVRHEILQTEHHAELCGWLESGAVEMLSVNDHYPVQDAVALRKKAIAVRGRVPLPLEDIEEVLRAAWTRRGDGEKQVEELVGLCAERSIPLGSHDDETEADVRRSAGWGVSISEFPATLDLARLARTLGAGVVLGAPNVIRGGSHLGRVSVDEAVVGDAVDALCSDYHYPSLFCAPFRLPVPLTQAWPLVSEGPARLAGLAGRRGALAPGADADVLLVDQRARPDRSTAALASVWRAGEEVWRGGSTR